MGGGEAADPAAEEKSAQGKKIGPPVTFYDAIPP